jgi:DNA-binding MarR family transcriptional regulator
MGYEIDITEVSTCVWRRARRTTRRLTQLYDRALAPGGLTAGQFDILANLFGASLAPPRCAPVGELAARMGMHPTTLTRELRPLQARGLIEAAQPARDRRVRPVRLTGAGRLALKAAVPLWRAAQQAVEREFGPSAVHALSADLDRMFETLSARAG